MNEGQENRNSENLFQDVQPQPLFSDTQSAEPPVGKPLFQNDLSEPGDASFVKTIDTGASEASVQPVSASKPEPVKEEPVVVPEQKPEPVKEEPAIVPEQKTEPVKEEPAIVPEQKTESVKEETPELPKKPVQKHIPGKVTIAGNPQDLSLGEIIKQARIAAGYTQEEAYRETRIIPRYQEAIETEKFDILPGGSFPAVYIRTLCRFYHLDDASQTAAMEKVAVVCRKSDPPAKIYEDVQDSVQINEAEHQRFRKILAWSGIGIAVLLVLIIGIVIAVTFSAKKQTGTADSLPAVSSVNDLENLSAPQMPVMRKLPVPEK